MSEKLTNILSNHECPTQEVFQKYLYEGLNRSERHQFEAHLASCPFCRDALEGMQSIGNNDFVTTLNEVNYAVDERVNQKFSFMKLSIAASVILALLFGGVYVLQNQNFKDAEQLSVKTETADEDINKDQLAPEREPSEETEDIILKRDLDASENMEEQSGAKEVPVEEEESKPELERSKKKTETTITESMANQDREAIDELLVTGSNEEASSEKGMSDKAEAELGDDISETVEAEDMMGGAEYDLEQTTSKSESTYKAPTAPQSATTKGADNKAIVDFNQMLAYAQETLNSYRTETRSVKKTKTMEEFSAVSEPQGGMSDRNELQDILNGVKSGQYQQSLTNINKAISNPIYSENERASLKWMKAICQLKLGQNAESTLKELKKSNSPYQKKAKTLYKELY